MNWKRCPLTGGPMYDYAPDVRVVGDWMYFCASRKGEPYDFYRTRDPEGGVFERIPGAFDFWDPNLFVDDDGRFYFYWGCSNMTPIWGVELDLAAMEPLGEPVPLIENRKTEHGWERTGENHHYDPGKSSVAQLLRAQMAQVLGCRPEEVTDLTPAIEAAPEQYRTLLRAALSDSLYIEGAWMTKHGGKYYLQYACPGAQYNVYCDGVYVGRASWAAPEWMLLSYGKRAWASSEDKPAANAVDENVQTWWRAGADDKAPRLTVDLGDVCTVNAVQVNFADDMGTVERLPEGAELVGDPGRGRYIEEREFFTRWLLETSTDGESWIVLEDRREANTDLTHDLAAREGGVDARYVRLTVTETAYHAPACISGLRVFGRGRGGPPEQAAQVSARRRDGMTMEVRWRGDAVGCEVLWGHSPNKLYHSFRVFGKNQVEIRGLKADVERYYVRVDAFNENGITAGETCAV